VCFGLFTRKEDHLTARIDSKKVLFVLSTVSLFACGGATGGAASDSMKFLPEGSTGVMVIDVKKALASPIMNEEPFKTQIAQGKEDSDYKELVAAGLDPFTQLNTVVIAGKTDPSQEIGVAILSGSFDAAKVAEKGNAEATKKGDKVVFEVLGTGMLVMGPKAAVDSSKAGKGLDGSPEVKKLLSLADNSKTMFGVGSIPAALLGTLPPMVPPQIKNIQGMGFSVDVSSGVSINALARFASDADATAIKGAVDVFLPMAKGQVPDDVMSALKTEAKKTDLTITFTLTTAQIKELAAKTAAPKPEPMPTPAVDPGAAPGAAPATP
jgi:hypothetical protein